MPFQIGTRCWYPIEELGWIGAEIIDRNDSEKNITLQLENDEIKIIPIPNYTNQDLTKLNNDDIKDELMLRNPPIMETTDDLTSLSYLNEPAVLHAIKERFTIDKNIYTYSGIVLIAVNPFDNNLSSLYDLAMIDKYAQNRDIAKTNTNNNLQPHLFAIADKAFSQMIKFDQNQTIIVSGESGSGKTVSAKYIMRYYASVQDETTHSHKITDIENKILATNPIMEAFGNAKTTRNDNSSRFGKYLSIKFNAKNNIIGAQINTYLLERSRLCFQPKMERNYHIFYQLLNGLNSTDKTKLHLTNAIDYFYLNQGENLAIDGVDDSLEFQETQKSLNLINIDNDRQFEIFKILSGILHIGNIEIKKVRNDSSISSDDKNLILAAELLGFDSTQFAKWITKKQINTRSEKIISNLNFNQAVVVRDSVAKYIYSILFDWLVDTINVELNNLSISNDAVKSFIGVLDIYGFEHFEKNSFEQFCINYANEKLQQEFNQHVFKLEQEEYIQEEIEWSFIAFNDNQQCIDLIEDRVGILSLLDEESRLPAGSDESWTQKLYQSFDKPPTNTVFAKPRFGQTKFIVSHYAHDVSYDIEGFIEKNKDTVSDNHLEILKNTTNETLRLLIDNVDSKDESNSENKEIESSNESRENSPRPTALAPVKRLIQRKPTLGSLFKKSLMELMETINSTNVHYIRCIKPNSEKEAWKFDNLMVLSQLRACGVLETIKISCAGFPSKWTYEEFIQRYYMLVSMDIWSKFMVGGACNDLLTLSKLILEQNIGDNDKYQIGKTKIFFRAGMLAFMENLRTVKLNKLAIKVQKKIRGIHYRRKYLEIVNAIKTAQCHIRSKLVRKRVEHEMRTNAAILIQSIIRTKTLQSKYRSILQASVLTQSLIRAKLISKWAFENIQIRASTTIQKNIRKFKHRDLFLSSRANTIIIQSHLRRKKAQIVYAELQEQMNSVEAKLAVELIEFLNELFSQVKMCKDDYDSVKQLRSGDNMLTILKNDTHFVALSKELDSLFDTLQIKKTEIESMRHMHREKLENIRMQLKLFEEKDKQTKNKVKSKNVFLNDKLNNILDEIELLNDKKLRKATPTSRKINKLDKKMVGLGLTTSNFTDSEKTVVNDDISALLMNTNLLQDEINNDFLKSYSIPKNANEVTEASILFPSEVIIFAIQQYIANDLSDDLYTFTNKVCQTLDEIVTKSYRSETNSMNMDELFWLTNIFQIYSYISQVNYIGLLPIINDFKNLISTVYNIWMKKVIRSLRYDINVSNILLGSSTNFARDSHDTSNDKKMTHLLIFFYKIVDSCKLYQLEMEIANHILSDILKFINSLCFNDLCVKFFGLSWKLGLYLDTNINSMDQWFLKHNINLPSKDNMVHLRQISKFLQLRIDNLQDFKIIQEFCFMLNPIQLQTMLKKYKPTNLEKPIPKDIINYLNNIIKRDDNHDSLTIAMETQKFVNPVFDETNQTKLPLRSIDTNYTPSRDILNAHTLENMTQLIDLIA